VVVALSIVRLERPRRSIDGEKVEVDPVTDEVTSELDPVTAELVLAVEPVIDGLELAVALVVLLGVFAVAAGRFAVALLIGALLVEVTRPTRRAPGPMEPACS
jgi:hypothetical protein